MEITTTVPVTEMVPVADNAGDTGLSAAKCGIISGITLAVGGAVGYFAGRWHGKKLGKAEAAEEYKEQLKNLEEMRASMAKDIGKGGTASA